MTRLRHHFRPSFPFIPTHAAATRVKRRHPKGLKILGIILILLIFTLQDGLADAIIPIGPIASGPDRIYNATYLHDIFISQQLHYLSWRRNMAEAANNHTLQTVGATGLSLSTQVIQTVAGPEQVSMLNMDLTSPYVRLGVAQAYNRLISPDETLSSMARRTGAIAGINGDYFEVRGSGVPIGEEVINGQLWHSPNSHFIAVLGVTWSGRLTIGPESFSGNVTDGAANYPLYSLNHYSEINNGRLVLFTHALGKPDYIGGDPVAIIQPVAGSASTFTVRSVSSGIDRLPVLSGQQYALVGSGSAGYWLSSTLHKGDRISINEKIYPDADLSQALGGGPQLVKDGALYYDPHPPTSTGDYTRNPQTAVGITRDGTHALFVIFDGRLSGPRRSRGMTRAEVARFMLAHGAYNVMLFDSGGSSEMVARLPGHNSVSIINWPSGGYERPIANGLFVYSTNGANAIAAMRHCQLWHPASKCT